MIVRIEDKMMRLLRFIIIFFGSILIVHGQQQYECLTNLCRNGETCYDRFGSTESTHACECQSGQGFNCDQISLATSTVTCYGPTCRSGMFKSPSYPNPYLALDSILYLIFIPGATRITFTFSDPFDVEQFKDELTIGPGLAVNATSDLRGEDVPERQVHFFSGHKVPKSFSLEDTDSAWMFFSTDKNVENDGFQVNWISADLAPPVIICPGDITVRTSQGFQNASATWVEPTTSGPVFVESDYDSGHIFDIGRHAVIYTATDEAGNEGQCFFYVTVEDPLSNPNLAPVISGCPMSRTPVIFNTSPLASSLPVFFDPPNATNPANATDVIVTSSTRTPGEVFEHGLHLIVYTFVNEVGFEADCVIPIQVEEVDFCASGPCDPVREICHQTPTDFSVFVFCFVIEDDDTEPELFDCPEDITVFAAPSESFVSVNWTVPTAVDDSQRVVLESSVSSGSLFSADGLPTLVRYEATDMNNNSASCSFTVTVTADMIGPTLSCPSDIMLPLDGSNSQVVTWSEITANDPSGPVSIVQNYPPGASFPSGSTTPVVYVASDRYGNINFCSFLVIISDTFSNETCKRPSPPPSAELRNPKTSYFVGEMVHIACNDNSATTYWRCDSTGEWARDNFTCPAHTTNPSPSGGFPIEGTIAIIVVIGIIILVAMMMMFLLKARKDRKREASIEEDQRGENKNKEDRSEEDHNME